MAAPTFVLQAAIDRAVEAAKAGGGGGGLREPFIASPRFAGLRSGYHFKMGDQGLGYYFDPLNERPEGAGGGGGGGAGAGPSSASAARPAAAAPAELLAAAEAAAGIDNIQALDGRSARRLCAAFERAARANLEARLKHADEPHRFLQAEVDLDEMVKSLLQARARPRGGAAVKRPHCPGIARSAAAARTAARD
jgi:beta-catenin-like protein 1